MAEAAIFRAAMRAIGMSVPEFADHFGHNISLVRTWKKRGCPDEVIYHMGILHVKMVKGQIDRRGVPDGTLAALDFMDSHGYSEVNFK